MLETPPELLSDGNGPQPFNDDSELLYIRVPPFAFKPDGKLDQSILPLPTCSVNRQAFSKPKHVLLKEGCERFLVFAFPVESTRQSKEVVDTNARPFATHVF